MDAEPMQKPTSLTVIGIIIAILGAFGAFGTVSLAMLRDDPNVQQAMAASPLPIDTQIIIGGVGALVTVIAGIGIVMGANWARWLYIIYSVIGIGLGLFINPNVLFVLPSVVILAIFAFFLFRKNENAYFNRHSAA